MKQDQTKQESRLTRREFLGRSTQAAVGIATGGVLAAKTLAAPAINSRIIGANERLNVAVIGIRGQGKAHMRGFASLDNVTVKTLCDVDVNLFPDRVKAVEEIQGVAPGTEQDLRRVFDDKDIHVVTTATPNHWHALVTVWAVQAGKHVYVEKPCCHNVWEGRKMVEAARKYSRRVQVGFNSRGVRIYRQAIKFLHEGGIGDVYMARGMCFKPRGNIGRYPDGYMKPGEKYRLHAERDSYEPTYDETYMSKVDYDLWLGPAPKRKFNRNRFHYNWHWHWDYGNGDTGNQGPHQFDIARWGLNKNEHPVKIRSIGGMFAYDCAQETPNTQTSIYEYADGTILEFGTRGLFTNGEDDVRIGNLFYGSEGWMHLSSGAWKTYFGRNNEPGPSSETIGEYEEDPMIPIGDHESGKINHYTNLIDAIRGGSYLNLACDIEAGHLSTALPHLANISYRLGRDLTFDGRKEKFVGDREADKMLTRKYRKPYVVPAKV